MREDVKMGCQNKKIVFFGASKFGKRVLERNIFTVTYFVDSDIDKQGLKLEGIEIYAPEKLLTEKKEEVIIVITSDYASEIMSALQMMGFEDQQIIDGAVFLGDRALISLDFQYNSTPRYYEKPHVKLYNIINSNRKQYSEFIDNICQKYKDDLSKISFNPTDKSQPYWNNEYIPAVDGVGIYAMIANNRPKRYYEIGSGNSTKFAAYAIKQNRIGTRITSIDPEPRDEIEVLCDVAIRQPIETVDLSLFNELEEGDILFIDDSHRCFMNSDVTTCFLDILPILKPGVIVGIHDIFLPYDYPAKWVNRWYSEQYLLANILLWSEKIEILFPAGFIWRDAELREELLLIWDNTIYRNSFNNGGVGFWFTIK